MELVVLHIICDMPQGSVYCFKFKILLIKIYKKSGGPSLVCRCDFAFTSVSDGGISSRFIFIFLSMN